VVPGVGGVGGEEEGAEELPDRRLPFTQGIVENDKSISEEEKDALN
jgi:hypothetical protein